MNREKWKTPNLVIYNSFLLFEFPILKRKKCGVGIMGPFQPKRTMSKDCGPLQCQHANCSTSKLYPKQEPEDITQLTPSTRLQIGSDHFLIPVAVD